MGFSLKKSLRKAVDVGTLGLTSKKGLGLLFGKKDQGTPNSFIELDPDLRAVVSKAREGQKTAAGIFGKELERIKDADDSKAVSAKQQQQLRLLKGSAEDARRQAREQVARRGLGQSSVGLSAILRADEQARERMQNVRAMRPLMEQEERRARIAETQAATGGLGSILAAPGQQRAFIQGRPASGRSGGLMASLLPAAGTALGAYFGGPAGAAVGGQTGSALSGAISQPKPQQSALGSYWSRNPYQ